MPTRRRMQMLASFATLISSVAFAAAPAISCCGPITTNGQRLAALLATSGVDHLWLPLTHIDWSTGAVNPLRPGRSPTASHCSAYAAAMAQRLGVYLLRPPQHGQELLASAQFRWLEGHGAQSGWQQVDMQAAQSLANQGSLVVAAFRSPNPRRPGHIAVVQPSTKDLAALDADGPDEAQAGARNFVDTSVARGFAEHPGAWVAGGGGGVRFFAHPVDWAHLPAS